MTERIKLRRTQVAARYGLTVAALNRRLSPDRNGFQRPDGHDRWGAYWWEDGLPPVEPKVEQVWCGNTGHARPAVARVKHPSKPFGPALMCRADVLDSVRHALDEGYPVLITPLGSRSAPTPDPVLERRTMRAGG